jgi:hypothetical protein
MCLVDQPPEAHIGDHAAALLSLALRLKDAAARAGRPDVVAKADEAIDLLTDARDPVGSDDRTPNTDDRPPTSDGKDGNTVIRILDGLGF